MTIAEKRILSRGDKGTKRSILFFPSVDSLSDRTLAATCRAGSTKDSSDGVIELYRSSDGGRSWNKQARGFDATTMNGILGSIAVCYLTELSQDHIIAACM